MDTLLWLEDLLGELHDARRRDDLGQMVALATLGASRWASAVGDRQMLRQTARLQAAVPFERRQDLIDAVDELVFWLEVARACGARDTAADRATDGAGPASMSEPPGIRGSRKGPGAGLRAEAAMRRVGAA
jgi:hypothetical protein